MERARTGSWPVLVTAAALFLVLFWLQRQRSSFLAIERERDTAAVICQLHGLPVADVLALRDLVGARAPVSAWRDAAATFAAARGRFGDGLAAVVAAGHADAAEQALAAAGQPDAAWQRFRGEPAAVPGLRFLAIRQRFAGREPGRD